MIRIENISKVFCSGDEGQSVLKGINFVIGDNDFITIMGPSGGGKSTLLHIIGLLTEPSGGKVYYDDNEVNFKNEKALNKYRLENIGLIFQNANLIPSLTPLENLIVPMNSKDSYKEKSRRAKELLDKVGLSKKYNSNVSSLSGGESQRVAIVRALVNNPKIILCDEPTGSLDSKNSRNVMDLLLDIKKERKCTVIIVTHDREIGALGNRQVYLEDGEIHEVARNI